LVGQTGGLLSVRPQRFDQARPFFTLGVVALVWLFVPAVVKRLARATFYELQSPVEVTAAGVRQLQEFWALRTRSADELIAAGKQTADALATYELNARQLEQLAAENERLRAMLDLPADPGWRRRRPRAGSRRAHLRGRADQQPRAAPRGRRRG
jgi:rod shape-determining protein MreC